MKRLLAGMDIGGTKCAVVLGTEDANENIEVVQRKAFATPSSPKQAIDLMVSTLAEFLDNNTEMRLESIGISCGGPLDSKRGLILSPPNLPNWDRVDIFTPFEEAFQVPVSIQNDANACALAEWKWGAGKGSDNIVFLTFGTGMGAGLILNGKLYSGTNDMAGEVGHIRLEEDGPIGYGKAGSFEGFCSGGGIANYAKEVVKQHLAEQKSTLICDSINNLEGITAKSVGEAAEKGDPLAIEIYQTVGEKLGKGLSILIDILNPEKIIIGSIYMRQENLLKPHMLNVLEKEVLPHSLKVCSIVPSGLGEAVGDYAALSVAKYNLDG